MVIIGITGAIGHGKTTFGQALQSLETHATHYDSSQIITDLAQAWLQTTSGLPEPDDIKAINGWLRKVVPIINRTYGLNCNFSQIEIKVEDIKSNPADYQKLFAFLKQPSVDFSIPGDTAKETYRTLLQWMGGYFVKKIDSGIWYNYIASQIRRDHEDGIILCTVGGLRYPKDAEILRNAGGIIISIERPNYGETDVNDITERERQNIKVDSHVINDGDLGDLQSCAQRLYDDIKNDQLKPQYQSSPIS
ncbi:MAG: hypothetical protein ABIQ89_01775 [Candidatus Saccharimonadales bacterium]